MKICDYHFKIGFLILQAHRGKIGFPRDIDELTHIFRDSSCALIIDKDIETYGFALSSYYSDLRALSAEEHLSFINQLSDQWGLIWGKE